MTWSELAPPQLQVRTVAIDDPGPLLALLPPEDAYAWVRHGEGLVAYGEAARHKPASITEADEWFADLVAGTEVVSELDRGPAGAGLVAFGSFVFDPERSAGQSTLVVPQTVIGRRHGRSWLTRIGPDSGSVPARLRPAEPPRGLRFLPGALDEVAWPAAVAEAVRRIVAGGLDKVVLAREVIARAENDLDLRWLAERLAAGYPQCWTYLVDGLVGASPEMLVKREAGLAVSRVLAGTIQRSGDDDHDLNLAAALAKSSKDLQEHEYAVASVARTLSPSCSGMNVPEAPYVLQLPNVLHLATDVTGVVENGASSLALAAALHPSAAVCGTPTEQARALIGELEHLDRERYAGPVGWIDASGDGEWAIALRCGLISETDPQQIRLFAGCGIVAGSDPAAELAESRAKLVPMRDALT
ncbi:MAG TPA: isochorismate synthase, partial [Propionibacteriaceae bacterium]|nr:isochorismate synthase [Propionibacteriaceae bacterium]